MKFDVRIDGETRVVQIERDGNGAARFLIDGRALAADILQFGEDTYSILLDGRSFELRIQPSPDGLLVRCGGEEFAVHVRDPRAWRAGQGGALATEGRQQISAPMPGKVVRVLVAAGQSVEAGQGLAVVEAMKMQNEIRTPKSGKVERIFVKQDQAVAAGDPLAIIA